MKQYGTLDDDFYLWFAANDTSGSGGDGATPASHVRLAGAAANAAPVYSPAPVLLSHVSYPAGAYEIAIAATAVNGFAAGNTYAVFCTLAIDSQNPTGFVGSFDLKPVKADVSGLEGVCTELRLSELDAANIPSDIDAVKTKTDNLPSGIKKNVALSNFTFLMVDADGEPATGLPVTAQLSKDGAAFAPTTNPVPEVGNGLYKIDFIQAEMNADVIAFIATATGANQTTLTIVTS